MYAIKHLPTHQLTKPKSISSYRKCYLHIRWIETICTCVLFYLVAIIGIQSTRQSDSKWPHWF